MDSDHRLVLCGAAVVTLAVLLLFKINSAWLAVGGALAGVGRQLLIGLI